MQLPNSCSVKPEDDGKISLSCQFSPDGVWKWFFWWKRMKKRVERYNATVQELKEFLEEMNRLGGLYDGLKAKLDEWERAGALIGASPGQRSLLVAAMALGGADAAMQWLGRSSGGRPGGRGGLAFETSNLWTGRLMQ